MGRCIRYIPEGGSLIEVTCRTIQGRFLLRPGEELNQIVKGVLARAARLHEVQVIGAVYLAPITCWEHLSEAQYRKQIRVMLAEIEHEVEAARERNKSPLPARRVCRKRIVRQMPS